MKIERALGANEKMTWLLDQAAPMNFVKQLHFAVSLKNMAGEGLNLAAASFGNK